ncbi:MAG TPA: hypothetical protein VK961_01440 [Chthoniobacter sp.]|nr:hypothetical protein [Chthoniobacter sp.]
MKLDGKQITATVATFLLPPILYVLSSGPVLRFGYREKQLFIPMAGFYKPLFQGAKATHLMAPLDLYLKAWDVTVGTGAHSDRMYVIPEDFGRKMEAQARARAAAEPANSQP